MSYSALMESHSSGVQSYRHIYIVRSEDGGVTWNSDNACNVTPDADFDLLIYESLEKLIIDKLNQNSGSTEKNYHALSWKTFVCIGKTILPMICFIKWFLK